MVKIASGGVGDVSDARTYQYHYRPLQMGTQIHVVSGTVSTRCSLGFPAYYEVYLEPDIVVVYGVITASHCGLMVASVYQNVSGTNNFIGYMRDEGRFDLDNLVNPNDVDATFIPVESYVYRSPHPRPPPQTVSALIHQRGVIVAIGGYISSEWDLLQARLNNIVISKAGSASGYEEGYVRFCRIYPTYQVACRDERIGWYFITTAFGRPGDSGGPAYHSYTVVRDGMELIYARVYGTLIGVKATGEVSAVFCKRDIPDLCLPTAFTILYNVTTLRGVSPLTFEG